jgi:hypothetical protein
MHAATEVNKARTSKHLEMVNRTQRKVKDFTQTPIDYISVDLDYKKLKRGEKF